MCSCSMTAVGLGPYPIDSCPLKYRFCLLIGRSKINLQHILHRKRHQVGDPREGVLVCVCEVIQPEF